MNADSFKGGKGKFPKKGAQYRHTKKYKSVYGSLLKKLRNIPPKNSCVSSYGASKFVYSGLGLRVLEFRV